MRHVYTRSILSVIWLAAAIVSCLSGAFPMAVLYVIMSGLFFYSAYTLWKKAKDNKDSKGEE